MRNEFDFKQRLIDECEKALATAYDTENEALELFAHEIKALVELEVEKEDEELKAYVKEWLKQRAYNLSYYENPRNPEYDERYKLGDFYDIGNDMKEDIEKSVFNPVTEGYYDEWYDEFLEGRLINALSELKEEGECL